MTPVLHMPLAMLEGHHLLALVDEFIALLDERDESDPAVQRLSPNPYPDDADAAAEFRRGTRSDGLDQRLADALAVRGDLEPFQDDIDTAADAARRAIVGIGDVDGWLRTLSAMRLIMASRLGIHRTDAHDPDDPRFGAYDWLGYRLELLVQLADQRDAR